MKERRLIGSKDARGTDIRVGDAFEYADSIYIIYEDQENKIIVREFENQVEYGVDEPPAYIEREHLEPEDMMFDCAYIIGSVEDSPWIKELYEREIDIIIREEDDGE